MQSDLVLVFVVATLLLGALLKFLKKYGLPYSPALFFIGLGLGYFSSESDGILEKSILRVSEVDPRGILIIFLPALIFQSGFNSEWHVFKRQSKQIFILAFPSVLLSAFFLMFSLKYVLGYQDSHYTYMGAFMFGAILSCTDTVAVLSLLKQIGAPKKFSSLIEGQSLFNDGSCMVLYTICMNILLGKTQSVGGTVLMFFQMTVGGLLLGVIFGVVTNFLIRKSKERPLTLLNVTICMCYITYFFAEYVDTGLRVSGIMSLVGLGLFVGVYGRPLISDEISSVITSFWKYFIFMAQTIIFFMAGVLVGTKVISASSELGLGLLDFAKLAGLYVCMTLSRFFAILVFMSYLSKSGYGLTFKEVIVLTVGGLRGAVGISFSLIVAQIQQLPSTLRKMILFHMAGCAILTLLINSPLTSFVVKKLRMSVNSKTRDRVFFNLIVAMVQDARYLKQSKLAQDKSLQRVDWSRVEQLSGLTQLSSFSPKESLFQMKNLKISRTEGLVSEENQSELMQECRGRFLHSFKGILHNLYEKHQCNADSLALLVESADWDLDTIDQPLNSWEFLQMQLDRAWLMTLLFRLIDIPIIKYEARRTLVNILMGMCDTIEAYLNCQLQTEGIARSFPVSQSCISRVIKESSDNRELAHSFYVRMIDKSFPQIKNLVLLKKRTLTILQENNQLIKQRWRSGQLEDTHYKRLRLLFSERVSALLDFGFEGIKSKSPIEQLSQLPKFSGFQNELKLLAQNSQEQIFGPSEFLLKVQEKAKSILIITRGEVIQTNLAQDLPYNRVLGPGSFLGAFNLIQNNIRYHNAVYATSIVCTLCFSLASAQQLFQTNLFFKKRIWEQCTPLLLVKNSLQLRSHFFFPDDFRELQIIQEEQEVHFKRGVLLKGCIRRGQTVQQAPCLAQGPKASLSKGSVWLQLDSKESPQKKPEPWEQPRHSQIGDSLRRTHKYLFQ